MTIDAHHHLWRYDPSQHTWISDRMRVLRRDFLPVDLKAEIGAVGVAGTIAVQAGHSLAESRFLLEQARKTDFVLAVVGWLPLAGPGLGAALDGLAGDARLRGCRHVLQDEADDDYMLREDFNQGLSRVTSAGLVYDILIYERHLPQALVLVDRHPSQVFVLDHIGKPCIREGSFRPWSGLIRKLARRPNVYCKLSGMVTEADWNTWTYKQMLPYLETVLDAFGTRRVMFGSDWPMCLLASSYGRWFSAVERFVSRLGDSERLRVMGGTAAEAYGIRLPPGTMAIPADRPCPSSSTTA
ncbi:MAG: amidohydrolase family protein [Bryobacterales bacterium]|nr:amidohydrolase family protein [Bryobacterales bacterium]